MKTLNTISSKTVVTAVGLMSGTSLDGIDAAVVTIEGCGLDSKVKLIQYVNKPYDPNFRERLKELCTLEHSNVALVCSMNFELAERFAQAAIEAVQEAGMPLEAIDFISSHGQTVWHIPENSADDPRLIRSTLQLGDLSVLAKRTGRIVVGDFRPADMAMNGQGAPLAPYGDLILFRQGDKGRILQNIGGIGNCTALPPGAGPEELLAFDTGPGNMLIDQAVQTLSGGQLMLDAGGAWASRGTPNEALLTEMLVHPYFKQAPPKSTGREVFGKAYAEHWIAKVKSAGCTDADIVATATAFTARSIADGYRRFVLPRYSIEEVIVTGGGAHNRTLMQMLRTLLPKQNVMTSNMLGFDDDAKEAVIFALLGNDFLHGISSNLPAATGAHRATVLGKLALP
ncbi:anhydro-N-acetylmuramic acid kinase [Marinicrinis lubricantis]|uniref:Anhydro-N-acetylmuramic acid kinase n=1 Tax=Marinicrinis lubricantis TaxID=2086470 RepID=A0ABW1IR53_9BACL